MQKHAVRSLWLLTLVFAVGCSLGRSDSISAVTIEATCGSTADCPSGFECTTDLEHGPPTALCESQDPATTCPAGYETKALYGQVFCKPPAPIAAGAPVGRTLRRAGL